MKKFFISLSIFFILVMLVLNPSEYISVAFNGILVWATCVLPSIFPFMFFSKLFSEFGNLEKLCSPFSFLTKKLYNTPPSSLYIFSLSTISGYPVGAKLTEDLYKSKKLSRGEALRTITFTSNSGPMFIVGTVAVGMFLSPLSGYIILFSHITSAIINGLIYKRYKADDMTYFSENTEKESEKNEDIITKSMTSSVLSILMVGGYICIFFILAKMFSNTCIFEYITSFLSQIFKVEQSVFSGILNGIFEITNGSITIAKTSLSLSAKTIIATAIITFGGISIAFQSLNFLKTLKCKTSFFFLQKFTHAIISIMISISLCLLFFWKNYYLCKNI